MSYHTHTKVQFIKQNEVNLKAKKLCNEGHHNLNFTKYCIKVLKHISLTQQFLLIVPN